MADATPQSYHTDPQLYLYTSLTSGSSHIVTATSRLQTILKANKIDFKALDVATDDKARMLWGRRAGKRKLPGLVRYGMILGDLEQIEDWNEYGELKQNLSETKPSAASATPSTSAVTTPSKPPAVPTAPKLPDSLGTSKDTPKTTDAATKDAEPSTSQEAPTLDSVSSLSNAMRQVGFEAAKQAGEKKQKARSDFLAAVKSQDPELKKLDNSTAESLPPPVGTTGSEEAKKPESVDQSTDAPAEPITPSTTDDERTIEAKRNAATNMGSSPPPKDFLSKRKEEDAEKAQADIPTSTEVSHKANEAIAEDEKNKLEGKDLSSEAIKDEKIDVKVPTAKEIEEQANQAIVDDESSHVRFQGRGSVPHALSPEPPKARPKSSDGEDDLNAVKEDENRLGGLDHSTEGDESNTTVSQQGQEIGAKSPDVAGAGEGSMKKPAESNGELKAVPDDSEPKGERVPDDAVAKAIPKEEGHEAKDEELTKTASRQEQKVGVGSSTTNDHKNSLSESNAPQAEELTEQASSQEQKVGDEAPTSGSQQQEGHETAGQGEDLSQTESRQEQKVGVVSPDVKPKDQSAESAEDKQSAIKEQPVTDHLKSTKTTAAAADADAETLPGSKTQEQPAAAGDKAGESVQD